MCVSCVLILSEVGAVSLSVGEETKADRTEELGRWRWGRSVELEREKKVIYFRMFLMNLHPFFLM